MKAHQLRIKRTGIAVLVAGQMMMSGLAHAASPSFNWKGIPGTWFTSFTLARDGDLDG